MRDFDTVLVSDLHLGARNCRSQEFAAFLGWVRTPRLIVNGDLFECKRASGLSTDDVAALKALRSFAREHHVDWLRGNHDPTDDWCAGLVGLEMQPSLLLDVGSRTYLIEHGDRWDSSLHWPWMLVTAAESVYRWSQRLDRSHRLARRLKRHSKRFSGVIGAMRKGAVAEVQARGLHGVILGHSHVAADERDEGVHYLNCGCWTERPAGFVGVRRGVARTYVWDPGSQLARPLGASEQSAVEPSIPSTFGELQPA
ncbi:MAG: metallophosphoesterase family protein [Pirellulales bacterium]